MHATLHEVPVPVPVHGMILALLAWLSSGGYFDLRKVFDFVDMDELCRFSLHFPVGFFGSLCRMAVVETDTRVLLYY